MIFYDILFKSDLNEVQELLEKMCGVNLKLKHILDAGVPMHGYFGTADNISFFARDVSEVKDNLIRKLIQETQSNGWKTFVRMGFGVGIFAGGEKIERAASDYFTNFILNFIDDDGVASVEYDSPLGHYSDQKATLFWYYLTHDNALENDVNDGHVTQIDKQNFTIDRNFDVYIT